MWYLWQCHTLSSWMWEARRSWRKLANHWLPSGFGVSGSILCGAGCLGGGPVHQITFPHLRGDATAPMLEYELEKFPQSMWQGPKMVISLRPPSKEHWNIESNLILTLTMDTYQQQLEAKRADQDPERESAGAEASPKETPVPEEAPLAIASGSKAASPMETTCQGERDLETALGVVERIHALCLQIIHDMGSVREVEQLSAPLWQSLPDYNLSCAKTSPRVYQLYARSWRPPVRFCRLTYSTS